MKITLIAFGSLSSQWEKLFNEYTRLIKMKVDFLLIELKEKNFENIDFEKNKHTDLVISKLPKNSKIIYLTFRGKQIDSENFAKLINTDNITFIIGPSNGFNEQKLEQYLQLSFSKMTFPHQLFRIVVIEQIFRGLSINSNSKYHK